MPPTALASLDTAIARARAAGLYSLLDLHLNVGRSPAWTRTTGSEWSDYLAHGGRIARALAARYRDDASVVGFNANEPPVIDLDALVRGNAVQTGWWQATAPQWPVRVCIGAYAAGTPSPASGARADPARYAALDNGRGVILELHDYLNVAGSAGIYQPDGAIWPVQQGGTAEFHGWGGFYSYPNTDQSRLDLAAAFAPHAGFRDSGHGAFALALTEFGIDNPGNEVPYVLDKVHAARRAGVAVELWWNYDVAGVASNPFSARPRGAWRPAITAWMADPTAATLPP